VRKKTWVRKRTGEVRKTKMEKRWAEKYMRRLVLQDMLRCEKRLAKKKTERGN